jgi:hypothetical protein
VPSGAPSTRRTRLGSRGAGAVRCTAGVNLFGRRRHADLVRPPSNNFGLVSPTIPRRVAAPRRARVSGAGLRERRLEQTGRRVTEEQPAKLGACCLARLSCP